MIFSRPLDGRAVHKVNFELVGAHRASITVPVGGAYKTDKVGAGKALLPHGTAAEFYARRRSSKPRRGDDEPGMKRLRHAVRNTTSKGGMLTLVVDFGHSDFMPELAERYRGAWRTIDDAPVNRPDDYHAREEDVSAWWASVRRRGRSTWTEAERARFEAKQMAKRAKAAEAAEEKRAKAAMRKAHGGLSGGPNDARVKAAGQRCDAVEEAARAAAEAAAAAPSDADLSAAAEAAEEELEAAGSAFVAALDMQMETSAGKARGGRGGTETAAENAKRKREVDGADCRKNELQRQKRAKEKAAAAASGNNTPFACGTCGKCYASRDSLNKHVKIYGH